MVMCCRYVCGVCIRTAVHQWWAISIGGRLLKSVILSIGYNPTAKKQKGHCVVTGVAS